ncbi:unnamed protein product [Medioppia subpectinata]|uniref:ABC transporter domain-containing protein n=1 Tax=Medioppia subpectinata TaxID=1979941 RepID=A0A7R9KI38_9ACAR|nr:unnamed protein product [Medioppia subpectinata]CAG2104101.1 unnamed protein product [Medioppia subpectinata]
MELSPAEYEETTMYQKKCAHDFVNNIVSQNKEYDIIVDLGCGTGYLVDLLSQSVKHKRIVGVDVSPDMIAFAEQNHKPMDSVQYLVQDLSQSWDSLSPELKALESKVSLIVSDFVIHWFPDKSRLMHVVSKLLAKNGEFVANNVRTPDVMSLLTSDQIQRYNIQLSAGETGLALSSALILRGLIQWGVRQSTEVESQMTSVERIIEYSKLPQEAALTAHDSHKPPPDWPQAGQIEFKDMSLCYKGSDKLVLKCLNCVINSGEKIGICGRTGAGKSSIISALFRMVEPRGQIIIDGINTGSIGLRDLRSVISIIPQDPVVFTGTVRKNLDPTGEYSDQRIWSALEEVQLKGPVGDLPGQLDSLLAEEGANFSVGQRQLVCLARAILRHNRVLVLDEATANVDHQTDALIQTTIRHKFSDCTVFTIAHRLNTIIDCDRVLVLDAGEIIEFDEPFVLLQRKGQLYDMCRKTGKHMFNHLINMAKESHLKRNNTTEYEEE